MGPEYLEFLKSWAALNPSSAGILSTNLGLSGSRDIVVISLGKQSCLSRSALISQSCLGENNFGVYFGWMFLYTSTPCWLTKLMWIKMAGVVIPAFCDSLFVWKLCQILPPQAYNGLFKEEWDFFSYLVNILVTPKSAQNNPQFSNNMSTNYPRPHLSDISTYTSHSIRGSNTGGLFPAS